MITVNSYVNGSWESVSGSDSVVAEQEVYNQDTVLFLYDYSKGDEDGFQIIYSFEFDLISNKVFEMTKLSGQEVVTQVLQVMESGTKAVPLVAPLGVEKLKVKVSLINPTGSLGDLTVWLLPNSLYF